MWTPVAALQVQFKLSSPNHKGAIVFAQPWVWAGPRPAWKSPVNNGAYRALFTGCVCFAHAVLQRSSAPVSRLLSRQAPSPRRQSCVPTTDTAQSISVLLFDPLYRLRVGFFFFSLLTGQKGFCRCCRRVKRHWSCHGNYLHLQSVIFFSLSPNPLPSVTVQ